MSVKRYDFYCHTSDFLLGASLITEECEDGEFVLHSEYEALRARVARLEEDEKRINTLRELCGYVEDGSDTSVTIGQDDATKDWMLHIGNRKQTLVFSATFRELFDIARRALEEK